MLVSQLRGNATAVAITDDSRTLAVADESGSIALVTGDAPRLWHLDRVVLAPAEPVALEAWIRGRTRVRDDDAGVIATPVAGPRAP